MGTQSGMIRTCILAWVSWTLPTKHNYRFSHRNVVMEQMTFGEIGGVYPSPTPRPITLYLTIPGFIKICLNACLRKLVAERTEKWVGWRKCSVCWVIRVAHLTQCLIKWSLINSLRLSLLWLGTRTEKWPEVPEGQRGNRWSLSCERMGEGRGSAGGRERLLLGIDVWSGFI